MPAGAAPQTMPQKPHPSEALTDLRALAGWNYVYGVKLIMVVWLRWLFIESFPGFEWKLKEEDSKILISDAHTSWGEGVDKRPRIIVDRGPLGWENVSFDKTLGGGSLGTPVYRDGVSIDDFLRGGVVVPGQDTVVDMLSGSMNVLCYAREGLLAERIASFVHAAVRAHRDKLRQMGFFQIDSTSVGRETPEHATSNYRVVRVPVTISYKMWIVMLKTQIEAAIGECGLFENLNLTTTMIPGCPPCHSGGGDEEE